MTRTISGVAALFLAGIAVLGGAIKASAALIALLTAGAILAEPVLGTYALVALAQLDGIALVLDLRIPVSTFKIVSLMTLVALILTLTRNPFVQGRPRLSPPMMFSLLFAIWILCSFLMSEYRAESREHMTGFLQTMMLVPFIGLTVRTTQHLRILALIVALSGAVSAAFVILETVAGLRLLPHANIDDIAAWRGELRSAGASSYNPTTSSHLMTVSLMIAVAMLLYDRGSRLLWAVLAAMCLIAIPMMGARSAILAAGLGMTFLAFTLRKNRHFPLFVLATILAVIAALPLIPEALWERFGVLGDFLDGGNTSDRTLLRRLTYNLIGVELWAEHPIAGIGPGAFPTVYASEEFRWLPGRAEGERQLHNSYLEVAAEMGTVGILLFTGAVFSAAAMALRHGYRTTGEAQGLARAFGTAMAVFLVASLFMPNEDIKYMWILTALCAKASWLCKRPPDRTEIGP